MLIKRSSPTPQRVEVGTTLRKCSCCGQPMIAGNEKLSGGSICQSCLSKARATVTVTVTVTESESESEDADADAGTSGR